MSGKKHSNLSENLIQEVVDDVDMKEGIKFRTSNYYRAYKRNTR